MPDGSERNRLQGISEIILACETAQTTLDEQEWLDRYPQYAAELAEYFAADRWMRRQRPPDTGMPCLRRLGSYELLEQIGQGGMGVVYKARQAGLDRIVAVKTILGGLLATPASVWRFREEARCAARLQHPHIVTVYEAGEHEGLHYFSMEYVKGKTLSEVLKDGPLDPQRAVLYLKATAEAIHYAHQHSVLHRDLKPSNILIDETGQPQVTDFGLAKIVHEGASRHTATGVILGTAGYMPPEQADGRLADVNEQSDVYSLGAVLYETITGTAPFHAPTREQTLIEVINVPARPPRELNPDIPSDVEAICLKCLEKDPRKRYTTAAELAEDCQRFLSGQPVIAQPPSPWAPLRRFAARLETDVANLGLVAGIVAALLIGLAPRFGLGLDPAQPELNTMAALVALMAFWWLTDAIPSAATGLLPLVLFPVLGVLPLSRISRLYMDDIILMTLGGLLITTAVEDTGLMRRLASRMLAFTGDNPRRIVLGFIIATGGISMWVANAVAALIVLPLALVVLAAVEEATLPSQQTRNLATGILLGVAYSASIGGMATPFGTLSTQKFLDTYGVALGVTPMGWTRMGLPYALAMGAVCWLILTRWLFPVSSEPLCGGNAALLQSRLKRGAMSSAERRMLVIAVVTILLWISSGPAPGWGWSEWVGLPVRTANALAAMAMALLCFVLPAGAHKHQRLLDWERTARMPWGLVFFFGGGLALGAGITSSGLDHHLGIILASVLQDLPFQAAKSLGGAAFVAAITQMMSNFATTEIANPILFRVAKQLAMEPRLLMEAGILAAFCSFMLPASTPPNAVVYGTGRVTVRNMVKAGFWLVLAGIVVAVGAVELLG